MSFYGPKPCVAPGKKPIATYDRTHLRKSGIFFVPFPKRYNRKQQHQQHLSATQIVPFLNGGRVSGEEMNGKNSNKQSKRTNEAINGAAKACPVTVLGCYSTLFDWKTKNMPNSIGHHWEQGSWEGAELLAEAEQTNRNHLRNLSRAQNHRKRRKRSIDRSKDLRKAVFDNIIRYVRPPHHTALLLPF